VTVDLLNQNKVVRSGSAYQNQIIGVYSTSPGMLIGLGGVISAGGESAVASLPAGKVPVALTGKVPTKVSTENGPIKAGDFLTSSSVVGVAMKATKAGAILGQSFENYSGPGVGKVIAFVKAGYFNGIGFDDLAQNTVSTPTVDLGSNQVASGLGFSKNVLANLVGRSASIGANRSDIVTDRLAVGLEVITPKITADSIHAREITVDTIRANQIEGLQLMAGQILTDKIASLADYKLALSKTLPASTGPITVQPSLDQASIASAASSGAVVFDKDVQFKSKSIFSALAEFLGNVIFRGDVNFLGRASFNKDTAGLALVKQGADSVSIGFSRAYDQTPFVNITATMYAGNNGAGQSILNGDVRFVVQDLTASGFTIKLNKAAPADMTFSWTAIAVTNASTSQSAAGAPAPVVSSTVPASSLLPSPSPAAAASPTPLPSPTAIPSPSPTPTTQSTPSATPAR